MASIGHVAVGMAACRIYHGDRTPRWSSMALWSALSLLPDVDVLGFALGVEYADPWGHRGATHSLAASVGVGLAIGLAARWFKRPAVRTALFATVVLASHGLLDTLTDGGLGCALLWPVDLARYFAPWRPIPVAPIGPAFFSPYGIHVALTELVLFSPALLFALRPRRIISNPAAHGAFLALWMIAVWLIASGDPLRETIVGVALREDTAYASGFSERAFRTIGPGTPDHEVRHLLGAPFGESWLYPPKNQPSGSLASMSAASLPAACVAVSFERGSVVRATSEEACKTLKIQRGMSLAEVERLLGSPPASCWRYTWSPGEGHYRLRMVCFSNGRVETVIRRWA